MRKADAIRVFGNAAGVAKAAGISRAAVSVWGAMVPVEHRPALSAASQGALKPLLSEHQLTYVRTHLQTALRVEGKYPAPLDKKDGPSSVPGSRCLIDNHHFSLRRLSLAYHSVRTELRAWLWKCYGPNQTSLPPGLGQHILEQFLADNTTLSDKSIAIAQILVGLSAANAAELILTGKPLFKGPQLRSLSSLNEENWKKHWARRWRHLNELWFALDAEALTDVQDAWFENEKDQPAIGD